MIATENVIWISSNKNNEIIKNYLKNLQASKFYNINVFYSVEESINNIKKIRFEETKIIVDDNLFIQFIEIFQKNINNIYIIPKIIIFTDNKEEFINKNIEYKKIINNSFYNLGGISTNIDEINKFILNPIHLKKIFLNKEEDKQLVFENIDIKEKLILPIFYKALMEDISNDNIEKFNQLLYNKYSHKNNELSIILNSLKSITDIPIELLSKYYVRIYTLNDSDFNKDLNKAIKDNKKDNYLPYIKVLYEGIKLKSLPLSNDKILYHGSILLNKEIEKMEKYLNNKNKDLPSAIMFYKSFLFFSKEKDVEKYFLNLNENKSKEFSKVLFILENDDNIDYSLSTHVNIEELSYSNEKKILFFPFSSFEIKNINYNKNDDIYEIELLYLGKYIEQIKKDLTENMIPVSAFKKEIIKFGLIKPEIINQKYNDKEIIKKYEDYKDNIINNKNEIYTINNIIEKIEKNENIENTNNDKKQFPQMNNKKNNKINININIINKI